MTQRKRSNRERRAMFAKMRGKTPAQAHAQLRGYVSGLKKQAGSMEKGAPRAESQGAKKTARAMRRCAEAERELAEALEEEVLK